jgi:hypothetical protein
MPRLNVIVLTRTPDDVTAALWADVPTARQPMYANAAAKSVWSGATAADNTALQNGAVVESVVVQRVPPGSTVATVQAALQVAWQNYQTSITNSNPWNYYGSTWNGTAWTVTGVA